MNEHVRETIELIGTRILMLQLVQNGLRAEFGGEPATPEGAVVVRACDTSPAAVLERAGSETPGPRKQRAAGKGTAGRKRAEQVQAAGQKGPQRGLGARVLATVAGLNRAVTPLEAHAALKDRMVAFKQVRDLMYYLKKMGKLVGVTAEGEPARFQAAKLAAPEPVTAFQGAVKPLQRAREKKAAAPEPVTGRRMDVQAKLEQALSQRDRARGQGNEDLAQSWQLRVNEYEGLLAS